MVGLQFWNDKVVVYWLVYCTENIVEKTFVDGTQTMKFVTVFSLEN